MDVMDFKDFMDCQLLLLTYKVYSTLISLHSQRNFYMQFNPEIFKAYDIRGLVRGDLSEELAYRIGRAFVSYLRSSSYLHDDQSVVVGRDMRESGPLLSAAVMRGIQDEGVSVVNIGLSSTPLFNFACANFNFFKSFVVYS